MDQAQDPEQASPRRTGGTPVLEWISGAIGLALTLALLGVIGWQAWRGPEEAPPAIEVRVERIAPAAGGHVVEFTAQNLSPATAAGVQIEGELREGDRVTVTSQATLDYVPGRSERRGGLYFEEDPRAHDLHLRALGYAKP